MGLSNMVDEPEQLRKVKNCSDIRPKETPSQWIKRMKKEQKKNGKS